MHDTRQQEKVRLDFNGTNQKLYICIYVYAYTHTNVQERITSKNKTSNSSETSMGKNIFYFKGTKDVGVYTYTRTLIQIYMKELYHATD